MKRKLGFVLIVLFFLCNFNENAKGQVLTIYALDTIGVGNYELVDSVQIGFDENATMGLDTFLGEQSIDSDLVGTDKLRVIQRSQEDWECLYSNNFEPVYFEESFDSKVNFRPSYVDSVGEQIYFEIQILDTSILSIRFMTMGFLTIGSMDNGFFNWYTRGDECPAPSMTTTNLIETVNTFNFVVLVPVYHASQDEYRKSLYVIISPETYPSLTATESKHFRKELVLQANPVGELVSFKNFEPDLNSRIFIYNQLGQEVQTSVLSSNEVNVSALHTGLYYYSIIERGEMKYTGHFIKQ